MMRAIVRGALLTIGLMAAGCTSPTIARMPDDGYRVQVGSIPAGIPSDPATIESVSVAGDVLVLQVTYGGGCTTHDFALFASGTFMESLPVQTSAVLAHDAHGDRCRALVGRELRFDLTPLRRAYEKAYGTGGTLVLNLRAPGGPQAPNHRITYTF